MTASLAKRLKTWVELKISGWRQAPLVRNRRKERYAQHEVCDPKEHAGHSRCWTAARGVWYCRDCHEWYRVWRFVPYRPKRQREGW